MENRHIWMSAQKLNESTNKIKNMITETPQKHEALNSASQEDTGFYLEECNQVEACLECLHSAVMSLQGINDELLSRLRPVTRVEDAASTTEESEEKAKQLVPLADSIHTSTMEILHVVECQKEAIRKLEL